MDNQTTSPSGAGRTAGDLYSSGGLPGRTAPILIFLLAALILLINLGMSSLWGSEGRWAVIARFMFQSGEVFNPVLGKVPYWDKPLLSYWQILPFAYLQGGVDEFASRLPSALWALVLLFLTYDLSRRWLGKKSALMTAFVLCTTYSFVFWGRNAQVEMTNAAVIMLTLWYFYTRRESKGSAWILVLAALMGFGANMKGLPAVGVPVLCILFRSLFTKDWKWFPRPGILILAGVVFFAAFFLIPLAACQASDSWKPLYMVWKENVLRFFEPFDHKGAVYIYFLRIFDLAAPWSLMIPPALLYFFKKERRAEQGVRETLLAFAAIFLFFTLSGSRRPYYLLPILPFSAMLTGHFLTVFFGRGLPRGYDLAVKALGFLISLCFLLPLAGLVFVKPGLVPYSLEGLMPWAAAIAAGGVAIAAGFARRSIAEVAVPVIMVWLLFVSFFIPWQAGHGDDDRGGAAKLVAMNRPVGFLNQDDAKIIFYLNRPYAILKGMEQARSWSDGTGGILISYRDIDDPSWKKVLDRKGWQAYIHQKPGS